MITAWGLLLEAHVSGFESTYAPRLMSPSTRASALRPRCCRFWRDRASAVGLVRLDRHAPGHGGFHRVGRAPHVQTGESGAGWHVLNGLVRGAVFAQADGVVREHMDHALFHQRGHADGVAAVVAEREEGAAMGMKPPCSATPFMMAAMPNSRTP